jgi:hypothetical protein
VTIPNIPVVGGGGIPYIENGASGIPYIENGAAIRVNGTGIQFVQSIESTDTSINSIGVGVIADARVFMNNAPSVIPPTVPVTTIVGTPIVNMPGCVKVHKENARNPKNRNKMLVDDDPKGNTVLCDAGGPYYEPADYDYRDLSWQTIYTESEEAPEGIDTGDPPAAPDIDPPTPPETPGETAKEIECPPANARRIGDLNQAGTEKVVGYKLSPDKKECITQWEELSFTEQYLPLCYAFFFIWT